MNWSNKQELVIKTSLLCPFVSYDENEVLWIWQLISQFQCESIVIVLIRIWHFDITGNSLISNLKALQQNFWAWSTSQQRTELWNLVTTTLRPLQHWQKGKRNVFSRFRLAELRQPVVKKSWVSFFVWRKVFLAQKSDSFVTIHNLK